LGPAIIPAIANAIADAIGVRVKSLPITPEKMMELLSGKIKRTSRVLHQKGKR
jgi:hypothetical protein